MRGIDRRDGCIVVVRPDQYVAHVVPFEAYDKLTTFSEGFMLERVAYARMEKR